MAQRPWHEHPRIPWIGTVGYFLLALLIIWLGRFKLVGDSIAYIQAARYYSVGQTDLAITGWWSPLLPWLLVPFVKFGMEPLLALRLLLAGAGLLFAFGVRRLVLAGMPNAKGNLAFLLAILASLLMLYGPATPDLLLAAILTWYLAFSLQLLQSRSLVLAFVCGVLGGIAYLAKAYALPFVVAHLCLTFLLKLLLVRPFSLTIAVKQLFISLAVVAIVVAPWIMLISKQNQGFTINTAAKYWTGMEDLPAGQFPPIFFLQEPRPGRMMVGENPVETKGRWQTWSPLDGVQGLKKQYQTVVRNLSKVSNLLDEPDIVGLLKISILTSFIFSFPFRRRPGIEQDLPILWLGLSALLFVGGYLLVWVAGRYLWPVWGIMIALVVIGAGARGTALGQTANGWHRLVLLVAGGLLIANLFLNIAAGVVGQQSAEAAALHEAGRRLPPGETIAATDWNSGLFATYWNNGRYLGVVQSEDAAGIVRELSRFGSVTLLVKAHELSAALSTNNFCSEIKLGTPLLRAFRFE